MRVCKYFWKMIKLYSNDAKKNILFVLSILCVISLLVLEWKSSMDMRKRGIHSRTLQYFVADGGTLQNGSLQVLGHYKNRVFSSNDVILQIANVQKIIEQILENRTKFSMSMREIEPFDYSADSNTTTVSFSSLYKQIWSSLVDTELKAKRYFLQNRKVSRINCSRLFMEDSNEVERAKALSKMLSGTKNTIQSVNSLEYANKTRNCKNYISKFGYIMDSLTTEEKEFPVAYSIIVYKDPQQFEILLRAIYRPQNFYCIHVDKKTAQHVFQAFSAIVKCFENVFLASERIAVRWGEISVLEPELVCMKDLLRYKKWRYFINLTGQEFPLRTNYELVKILKIYNGANDLESTIKRTSQLRWRSAGRPPHKIHPTKGSVHITVNRQFVHYVVNNPKAKDFLNWSRRTAVPDETFFSSLNHNPHLRIPGSYKGEPETDRMIKPFLTRFKNWGDGPFNWPCRGQRVRQICVFGIGDLPLLGRRPEFFANKFYYSYEPFALKCMDELHFNRTRDEYLKKLEFRTQYYKELQFIKNVYLE